MKKVEPNRRNTAFKISSMATSISNFDDFEPGRISCHVCKDKINIFS